MIDLRTVESIQTILIDRFGGTKGIRDLNLLDAAITRPFATFDQKDLYPSTKEKAAALFESVIINHPFLDGNKRIEYVLMRIILLNDKIQITATQDEKYAFVIKASTGDYRYTEIKNWILENHSKINQV
jgi:death on curing protein